MLSVFVQVWGPRDLFCGYDWITVGKIKNPDNLDIDYLKEKAISIINGRDYKPFLNAARLKIIRDETTEMKITVMDLW